MLNPNPEHLFTYILFILKYKIIKPLKLMYMFLHCFFYDMLGTLLINCGRFVPPYCKSTGDQQICFV